MGAGAQFARSATWMLVAILGTAGPHRPPDLASGASSTVAGPRSVGALELPLVYTTPVGGVNHDVAADSPALSLSSPLFAIERAGWIFGIAAWSLKGRRRHHVWHASQIPVQGSALISASAGGSRESDATHPHQF
jgi:hypothetical protein